MTKRPGGDLSAFRFRRLISMLRRRRLVLRIRIPQSPRLQPRGRYAPPLHHRLPCHCQPCLRQDPNPRCRRAVSTPLRFPQPRLPSGATHLALRPHQGLNAISEHQAQGSGVCTWLPTALSSNPSWHACLTASSILPRLFPGTLPSSMTV
ncbi:hypothetical protein PVAP13_9KG526600 [Panicum virgatum]|uniref:Uncharacterized protein n=1 Tax=Panicum virgatum TaxID=38727 RepID=A0A8T0NX54_PANVG|nr:hypothetical protein PVAP13_9KG526600 [Panicum virgatum]KAG2553359.1 hypothetical protein PVAP13_9KG526600 [Panicum virgatum]